MADTEDRPEEETREAMETLLAQAKALKLKVDKRWSPETLAERVKEAQELAGEDEKAVFEAAPKVWVFLLRDGWPVADERHNAGETIEVTQEIADKWFEAGVARPGKAPVA